MLSRDSSVLLKVAEEEAAVKEEAKPESESAVEVPKAVEETPAVVEEKESTPETTNVAAEIPPPLPSSPPPVETPAVSTPTIIETPAPVQPAEPEIVQAEPEDDTVGGGEGLAEPPEGLNTSDIEKEVAEVPLVNGNHGNHEEYNSDGSRKSFETSPDDIKVLADKIEEIKLSKTADNVDIVTNELLNDVHETNGVCGDAIAVTNGDGSGHVEDN